jgi:hypothetical protein
MKKVMIKEKGKEATYYLADRVDENGIKIRLWDTGGKLIGWFYSDRVDSFGIVAD